GAVRAAVAAIARAVDPAVAVAVPATVRHRAVVPAEVPRAVDAEERLNTPAEHPRRGYPGPTVRRVIDVLRRVNARGRRRVRVLGAVGYPDPAVLRGVDPLATRRRLRRRGRSCLGRRFLVWLL